MFFLLINAKFHTRFPAQKLAFFRPDFLVHLHSLKPEKQFFKKLFLLNFPRGRSCKRFKGKANNDKQVFHKL